MKVLYYVPLPKKRFKGGITVTYNYLTASDSKEIFYNNNIELIGFNNSPLPLSNKNIGKLSIGNILQFFIVYFKLLSKVLKHRPDIIHINSSRKYGFLKDLIIIYFLKAFYRKKIILHIRFAELSKVFFTNKYIKNIQLRIIKNKVHHIITLSKGFKQELIEKDIGIKENKISVLYNFHDSKIISEISHTKNKFRIVYIGSINERKGFVDLLQALKSIPNEDYILNVAGEFTNDKIKKKAYDILRKNNLSVVFRGYLDKTEKEKLLIDGDLLVLPSYGEGLPIVIFEALAKGCAIIASHVGSIPEVIENKINGYLINPGDVESLRSYIEYLQNHKEILCKLQDNNVSLAKKFTKEIFINNLIKIYRNV